MTHLTHDSKLCYSDVAPQDLLPLLNNASLIFGDAMKISVKGTFADEGGTPVECTRFEDVDRQQLVMHLASSVWLLPIEYRNGRADLWQFPHGIAMLRIEEGD